MNKTIKASTTTYPYNHKGFTLAETLITLVVIGVVAALIVPTIIVKHQKEETITRLKKVYSALSQITNKSIADNGPIESWTIEQDKTKEFFEKYMAPYLNIGKKCEYDTTGDCRFEASNLNTPNTKFAWGNPVYTIVLADGSALFLRTIVTTVNGGNGITIPRSYVYVVVDINGHKGPNVKGKDIFAYMYWIQNDFTDIGGIDLSGVLLPYGGTQASTGYNREYFKTQGCNKNSSGSYCAALIMADNWEIKKDYPW